MGWKIIDVQRTGKVASPIPAGKRSVAVVSKWGKEPQNSIEVIPKLFESWVAYS